MNYESHSKMTHCEQQCELYDVGLSVNQPLARQLLKEK